MTQFLKEEQPISYLPKTEFEEEKEQEFAEEEEVTPSQRDLKPHKDKGLKIEEEDLELLKKSREQYEEPFGQRSEQKKKKRVAHRPE